MKDKKDRVTITNRAARRDYFILETIEAGLELKGSEVKSLRAGKASLAESFARVEENEIFLHKMHISPYEYSPVKDYDPVRPRKLLLHRKEIDYLINNISQKRLSLVPLSAYFKKRYAKVELALCQGKKHYDKREVIKRKEAERDMSRAKRYKN